MLLEISVIDGHVKESVKNKVNYEFMDPSIGGIAPTSIIRHCLFLAHVTVKV